jgi:predicted RNase H-like HicB family nuclease
MSNNAKGHLELTFIIRESITGEGYVGYVAEIPGAASEGDTKEELVENLKDAVKAVFDFNKNHRPKISHLLGNGNNQEEMRTVCI